MLYEERISFDGGKLWFQLKYLRQLEHIKLGWKPWLLWLGVALVGLTFPFAVAMLFMPLEYTSGGSGSWGMHILFFIIALVMTSIGWLPGLFLILHYRRLLAREKLRVLQVNEEEESHLPNIQEVVIHDVQRKDERTVRSTSTHTGSGFGVNIGFGLLAGAGGGSSIGLATSYAVIGWQFYTSIGIMLLPDDAYAVWLNNCKPKTALYSVRSVQ